MTTAISPAVTPTPTTAATAATTRPIPTTTIKSVAAAAATTIILARGRGRAVKAVKLRMGGDGQLLPCSETSSEGGPTEGGRGGRQAQTACQGLHPV